MAEFASERANLREELRTLDLACTHLVQAIADARQRGKTRQAEALAAAYDLIQERIVAVRAKISPNGARMP